MTIDHFHNISRYEPHTNATFQQHYWVDISNYVPGGPVIIHAIGEYSPEYGLEWRQKGMLREIANATGGCRRSLGPKVYRLVLFSAQSHDPNCSRRYYSGGYDIVPDHRSTTENLRFHSTEQALADLAYFAQRATFWGLEDRDLAALPGSSLVAPTAA
ncbi:uncharacterized protein Z519_09888 [Cladophialophora bantiana CBS 173.52]|uniref:Uncharacterized protein n=1 Tax=Cladophialophora bantiana (strain ATCC 10958 / CBS 173.52 / CDC B-1940 / NIH 8579) TaxID=1442370 RepID=A0A0D2EI14_CLAB1|nr:uncharacterized protein Z519_09888 [Cladophialophora bantiana CBS 173.52]KIW89731.1 hypothetical protein Z519_09888 [Cladophialophora bantiana CBS 173.52]